MAKTPGEKFLALPELGSGPGVLVLHAWWGLNDFIRNLCRRLAAEGYVALAPDLYHGSIATTIEEADRLSSKLSQKQAGAEILAATGDLLNHPAVTSQALGMIGFSLGAYLGLKVAQVAPEKFRAIAIFYGTHGGDYSASQAAFLGHFAEVDEFESASEVNKLERSLRAVKRPVSFYTYKGTGHWFFESDRDDAFVPDAADLAWRRTLEFFQQYLQK